MPQEKMNIVSVQYILWYAQCLAGHMLFAQVLFWLHPTCKAYTVGYVRYMNWVPTQLDGSAYYKRPKIDYNILKHLQHKENNFVLGGCDAPNGNNALKKNSGTTLGHGHKNHTYNKLIS